jgi:hypothetical protein
MKIIDSYYEKTKKVGLMIVTNDIDLRTLKRLIGRKLNSNLRLLVYIQVTYVIAEVVGECVEVQIFRLIGFL